ncbi:MAG TPA: hypothetical protein VFT74_11140 [Isosphaeraceae bacterium]|nr:hypothetical protein [Isosphaeraceae bacterium]
MWGITPTEIPSILVAVLTLVLLEGLLSADNALVLAVMVRHLPKHQQTRALRYGIWGAFVFRLIAVVFAYQLIQFWFLKVVGGAYLIYLTLKHFVFDDHGGEGLDSEGKRSRFGSGFWGTVINVELADIAFSIDSILAAVGMVESLPESIQENETLALAIIYIGGVLGIIMMRLVAGVFLVLLDRYKGLAGGAYLMVAWIGLKLIAGGLHDAVHPAEEANRHVLPTVSFGVSEVLERFRPPAGWRDSLPDWVRERSWEVNDVLFWVGMVAIAVGSLLYRPRGDKGGGGRHGGERPGEASPNGSASAPETQESEKPATP